MKLIYTSFKSFGFFLLIFLSLNTKAFDIRNPFEQKVFIENKGQFDGKNNLPNSDIRYVIENNARIFFTPKGLTYQMAILEEKANIEGMKIEDRMEVNYSFIHMDWVGANPLVEVIAENKDIGYYTYPDGKNTIMAYAYKKLVYKNLYPNIDVEYTFHPQEGIKYNIILHPGADPSLIKMKYTTTKTVSLDNSGNIRLASITGDVIDHKPVTFYENGNQNINSQFVLSGNTVSFKLDNYDNTKTVVIDPWTTNPAFIALNRAYNICKDAAGNIYSTGGTNPFYLKKFSPAGVFQWSFTMPNATNWSVDNVCDPAGNSFLAYGAWQGNVDCAVNTLGVQIYNNTAAHNGSAWSMGECYAYVYSCFNNTLYAGGMFYTGGFTQGQLVSSWIVSQTNGNHSSWAFNNASIEIRSMRGDDQGNLYAMTLPVGASSNAPFNRLIKMSPALVNIWNVADGYNMSEAQQGYYQGYCCNGFNGVAVGCFVYTTDGLTISKWDKNTGAAMGTTTLPGGAVYTSNSGLHVDVCGNLYAGSTTGIYKFDQNLVPLGNFPTAGAVYDIMEGNIPGEVIASGNGFISSVNVNSCSNLSITTTFTPPTGCGLCNAVATATSNACSVTYSWSTGATTPTISNLCPGTYTVKLVSGCSATNVFTTVIIPGGGSAFTVTPVVSNVKCFGGTGSATVNVTGGSGNFSYTWTPTAQTNSVATNLSAGIYTVNVKDNNGGCITTVTLQITQPPALTLSAQSSTPTACTGTSITLSATMSGGTAAYNYTWTGGPTNTNYSVTQSTGGVYTYTVNGTDANSCAATQTLSITFVTTPTITATSATVCFGTVATLTANGALAYTWTPGNLTTAVVNLNPPVGVNVYNILGSSNGCTATTTASVTVNALPVPTATNTGPYCAGTTIQLNGSGATSYTWTGPSSYTSNLQNPSILSSSVTNSGLYTFSVTDANGCKGSATTSVVVNALPVIVVNNPAVCLNQTILLTANGGTAYSWSGPLSFSSTLQNPNIPNATLAMAGAYTVVGTSPQGCTNTAVSNVSVFTLPNPQIISNSPVCVGNSLNLNGSGGATYSWSGPNSFTSTLQNPVITGVTPAASGVYTLIASAGTCSASTTGTVIVNPLPVIAFTNSNVLCNGGNTGLSTTSISVGTGPFNYFWNNGQTTANGTGLTAGTYTLVVTDANGCISSAVTTITEPTPLTLNINNSAFTACANTPINLSGVVGGGTGPNYTYTWNPGPNTSAYNVTEPLAGSYTYVLNATDQNGCTINKSITLTFFPQPTVTATSATVCAGEKAGVSASGATSYTWMPVNVTSNTFTYNGTSNMNLTIVGETNGCKNTATANIVVNPLPVANVTSNSKTGCVPACMSFTCSTGSNVQTIGWNFEDGGTMVTNSLVAEHCYGIAGDYNITAEITDINGCKATATFSIGVYPIPTADFNYAPYKPIVNNADVTFTDASFGANIVKWDWYFKNLPKPHSNQQNPVYIYDEEGTYAVALVVTSDHGCVDTIVQTIVVGPDYGIYVPNIFTPNGDNLNDTFQPKGFGITKYELRIFNRWGEQLMFTNDFAQGWDGMYKGKLSQDDTYIWKINLTNVFGKSHELTGHVTLIK